ncbi:hypothetical protein BDZ89DRAFT_565642 [Hymenopellis radicata]|nr:hypothetical protein BDZ89DRAFT_565642 [Hymenopellis radicata]
MAAQSGRTQRSPLRVCALDLNPGSQKSFLRYRLSVHRPARCGGGPTDTWTSKIARIKQERLYYEKHSMRCWALCTASSNFTSIAYPNLNTSLDTETPTTAHTKPTPNFDMRKQRRRSNMTVHSIWISKPLRYRDGGVRVGSINTASQVEEAYSAKCGLGGVVENGKMVSFGLPYTCLETKAFAARARLGEDS